LTLTILHSNLFDSGLICVPATGDRLDQLKLPLMVPDNTDRMKTAYTISIDYAHSKCVIKILIGIGTHTRRPSTYFITDIPLPTDTTTGISAHDRALTARSLADPTITDPKAFNRPGHVFPLRYTEGGVLRRVGHTEASVGKDQSLFPQTIYSDKGCFYRCHLLYSNALTFDPSDLCKLAGLQPVGVICELVKDDGSMARRDDCRAFAEEHGLKLITIADLVRYRLENRLIDI
jgi:3,4-dihydroxy 2-butanone 4-phosphate synthase